MKQPEGAKFPKDAALNEKISLLRHDITKLEVDAIVNAGGWRPVLGGRRVWRGMAWLWVCPKGVLP